MAPRRQQRIDRRWSASPISQNVLQSSGSEVADDINPRLQHDAVPGKRPIRHCISAVGPQSAAWLDVHENGVRPFESPRCGGIVIAETKKMVELSERLRSAVAVEIRGRGGQYPAIVRELVHDRAAIVRLTDAYRDVDLLGRHVNETVVELEFNVETGITLDQLRGQRDQMSTSERNRCADAKQSLRLSFFLHYRTF